MVNASCGCVIDAPERRPCAVSLVLRDMGNGVTRVLLAELIAEVPAPEFFEMFRPLAVPLPLPEKVRDALACAALDLDPDREFVGCYMRSLDGDITDFFIW